MSEHRLLNVCLVLAVPTRVALADPLRDRFVALATLHYPQPVHAVCESVPE